MTTTTDLDAEIREMLDETIDHLNGNHADTVLLIARYVAGCPEADEAELANVDHAGVDLDVGVGGARTLVRWSFPEAIESTDQVYDRLYGTIGIARAAAGDGVALTSIEQETVEQATIPTFYTSVTAVSRRTDALIELELGGGLEEFHTMGGDQFFYFMLPQPGAVPIPDGYTMADYMAQAEHERPVGAYYTVRRWDAERQRMTVWVVEHGHDAGVSGWAANCAVGDRVVIWGPRHSFGPIAGTDTQLLVADETGFAAVAAILDETPAGVRSLVVLETVDASRTIDLPGGDDVQVHWVFRGADDPGTGDRLLAAVRDLDLTADGLVAFGAAESRQITAVRKHVRHEVGVAADRVSMTGYWRRGD